MDYQILVPVLLLAVGWMFEKHRDRLNKRRELCVEYLITAYRNLELAAHREMTDEVASKVENAIADIQLFGTAAQAHESHKIADGFARSGTAELHDLLTDLRADLRAELGLESLPPNIKHLRFRFSTDSMDQLNSAYSPR